MSGKELSSSSKLIVLSCKNDLSDVEIKSLRADVTVLAAQQALEATSMFAYEQGVYPLFFHTLKEYTSDLLDDEMKEAMSYIAHDIQITNEAMKDELLYLTDALETLDIEVMPFKGPVLAEMLYGDVSLRQFSDLDILIKKEDIDKVALLLDTEGYKRSIPLTQDQEELWRKTKHDTGYVHPEKGIYIEVHWALLDDDYPLKIELDDFWKKRQLVHVFGYASKTFSTEDLLYYLCIHGSKHLWEKVVWIKDIDVLIRNDKIAWEEVIEKAEESGFNRMVYLGLTLSSQLFETPLPHTIKQRISKCTGLDELTGFVMRYMDSRPGVFIRNKMILRLFADHMTRFLYLHKIVFKLSFLDLSDHGLPKYLYWAYYLIRPYRLVKRHLLSSYR